MRSPVFIVGFASCLMAPEYTAITQCLIMLTVSPGGSLGMFDGSSLTKMNLSFANFLYNKVSPTYFSFTNWPLM